MPPRRSNRPQGGGPSLYAQLVETMAAVAESGPQALMQQRGGRRPEQRREFASDPARYIRDVLGWSLTAQQEEVTRLVQAETRLLIPSGNNIGKTFLLGAIACYFMDAVASLPAEDRGAQEQGCILLLPGPGHDVIRDTIFGAMLEHCSRAESRGFAMPGLRSDRSVMWRVGPRWFVRAMSPPKDRKRKVTHTASGRHHRNQVAIIEEGMGVEEPVWRAVEGMCSGEGNRIISSFNPTEPSGSAYERARNGTYHVIRLSTLDHPNVRARHPVIPEAVSFEVIDRRVRAECRDLGAPPAVLPNPSENDFLYALPPEGAKERGGRDDGVPGHPAGKVHVYRPEGMFVGQVLGAWPTSSQRGLFDAASWDAAVERWRARERPEGEPTRVGVDAAREGADDSVAAPAWGASAGELIERWERMQRDQDQIGHRQLQARSRVYIGEMMIAPKGDGYDVATWLWDHFPDSPFIVDEGSVGASVVDNLRRVLDRDVTPVSFGGSPEARLDGEPWCVNMRSQLYSRAALLVRRGLVDIPPDPQLREEALAHHVEHKDMSIRVTLGERIRTEMKPAVKLVSKDEVKSVIGRSPDKCDGFVLALFGAQSVRVW